MWHPGKSMKDYKNYFFTEKTFDELVKGMSTKEIDAIKQGKVVVGMSKKAVLVSYGRPAEHRTPDLKSDRWRYWMNKRKQKEICFDNNQRALRCGSLDWDSPVETPIAEPIKPKPINPNEPWTGTWKVTGSLHGTFVLKLKQSGSTVKSIRGSDINFKGKVEGDRLKGRYYRGGFEVNTNCKITHDFKSFQGLASIDFNTYSTKGERQE